MARAIGIMNSSMIAFHLRFILGEPADSSEHKGVNVKQRSIFSLVQNTNVISILSGVILCTMYSSWWCVSHGAERFSSLSSLKTNQFNQPFYVQECCKN